MINAYTRSNAVTSGIQNGFRGFRPYIENRSLLGPNLFSVFWWRIDLFVAVCHEWPGHHLYCSNGVDSFRPPPRIATQSRRAKRDREKNMSEGEP